MAIVHRPKLPMVPCYWQHEDSGPAGEGVGQKGLWKWPSVQKGGQPVQRSLQCGLQQPRSMPEKECGVVENLDQSDCIGGLCKIHLPLSCGLQERVPCTCVLYKCQVRAKRAPYMNQAEAESRLSSLLPSLRLCKQHLYMPVQSLF
eukprot:1157087-Pelagomonas_calceolata.AAC.4